MSKKKVYFGKELQEIIKRYILSESQQQRQILYNDHINYAFHRIASSLVRKYKIQQRVQNSQVIILECMSNMTEKMHLFDVQRGKAFTYFTVVARNYILGQLDKKIRYNDKFKSINQLNWQGGEINLMKQCSLQEWEIEQERRYNEIVMKKTIQKLITFIQEQFIPSLTDQRHIEITQAIVQIIKDIDFIQNFNKKAIMLYIKQMSDNDDALINKVLKMVGKHYYKIKEYVIQNQIQLIQYDYI